MMLSVLVLASAWRPTSWVLSAWVGGQLAHREVAVRDPGQIERCAAGLVRAGQIEERWQERAALDCRGCDQLRDRQAAHLRLLCVQRRISDDAIGRAQIDAYHVSRHFSPTSNRDGQPVAPSLQRSTAYAPTPA